MSRPAVPVRRPFLSRSRLRAGAVLVLLALPSLALAGCGETSSKPAARPEASAGLEVWLTSVGDRKIQVIQAVREATGLGLAEAKALVERAPTLVKKVANDAEASALETSLRAAGATVEVRGRGAR